MQNLNNLPNITLLRELERRLENNPNIQAEISQLHSTLREVSLKLAESEALKSHFISNISNELVNPFTSILAIAENILGVEKENWKKVIHMVSLIHTEVFNLDFQLKNIFAAAKLEAGESNTEISLINMDQLLLDLIRSFRYQARRKHLQIEYTSENRQIDTVIYFKSDASKIQLILSNLLSNAIKFSNTQGKIYIHAVKDMGDLCLTVQDFGKGISKANEQIIYDRFKRIDTGINSINRGHGLGLSIVRALSELLGGRITFESKEGIGTTFKLELQESHADTAGVSTSADAIFFKEETF